MMIIADYALLFEIGFAVNVLFFFLVAIPRTNNAIQQCFDKREQSRREKAEAKRQKATFPLGLVFRSTYPLFQSVVTRLSIVMSAACLGMLLWSSFAPDAQLSTGWAIFVLTLLLGAVPTSAIVVYLSTTSPVQGRCALLRRQRRKQRNAFLKWLGEKVYCDQNVREHDGILIACRRDDDQPFADLVDRSLALIARVDPRRYAIIRSQIRVIVRFQSATHGSGRFIPGARACLLNPRVASDVEMTVADMAGVIVHEATHGRLENLELAYTKQSRVQHERICTTEQNRFLSRLPLEQSEVLRNEFDPIHWFETWSTTKWQRVLRRIFGRNNWTERNESDNAIVTYTKAIRLYPDWVSAHYCRGNAYANKEEYDQAIADYTEAIRLKPDFAEAYCGRGHAYGNNEEYDQAIADTTEAIRLKPDFAEAYGLRGSTYANKGEYGLAIADDTEAIRLEPDDAIAYYYRGCAYVNQEKYEQAIADHTEAIRLEPDWASAHYWRGHAYNNKEEYDKAIADYTEAIRLEPDWAQAHYWRGDAYNSKEEYDQAIADYTQAIRLEPDYAKAYCGRGHAYENKGEYDKAIVDSSEAIRLQHVCAKTYSTRGDAYNARGQYDQAIADYTEAIRLEPKLSKAYLGRVNAYEGKRRNKRALTPGDADEQKRTPTLPDHGLTA